jgi:excisionase family DNA binding protein
MKKLKEAAEILNVSESWLDKKIREGLISVIWLGGVRRISDEELERIQREGVK